MADPFWYDDPRVLVDKARLTAFFPAANLPLAEKLNALVRFAMYAGALILALCGKLVAVYLPLGMLLATKLMYDNSAHNKAEGLAAGTAPLVEAPAAHGWEEGERPLKNPRTVVDGRQCVPPTRDNPFMNPTVADWKYDPTRPPACPTDAPEVKAGVETSFYDGLFRDVSDVFGRQTNSRQFYTLPSTSIPNDRKSFTDFLYGDMGSKGARCKTGHMDECVEDDVRRNRRPVQYDMAAYEYM